MNISDWSRSAATLAAAGLSIVGVLIYQRHASTAHEAAHKEQERTARPDGLATNRPSISDLVRLRVAPEKNWGLQDHLSAIREQRLDSSRLDHDREIEELRQKVAHLEGLLADEAVIWLSGYMAGQSDGDGDVHPFPPR